MKWKLYILVCLLVLTFSGCKPTEMPDVQNGSGSQSQLYEIIIDNEAHYLHISEQALGLWEDSAISQMNVARYPNFSSVEEMQQKIRNGQISSEELATLYYNSKTNPFVIIDLDNIRDAEYPDDLQLETVTWKGSTYSFGFSNGYMSVLDDAGYEEVFYNRFTHFLNENQTIVSEEHIADRNANVIVYSNYTGTYKSVSYQLENGSKKLFVREKYILDYHQEDDSKVISDSIPSSIVIFGEDGVSNFFGWFYGFNSRPTTDWLLSFGLT